MTDPITPPPELVQPSFTQLSRLLDGLEDCFTRESKRNYLEAWIRDWTTHKITRAAQYGADQELEACCKYMQHEDFHGFATELRAARRPKPPSLKELALEAFHSASFQPGTDFRQIDSARSATIRRALEALPDD